MYNAQRVSCNKNKDNMKSTAFVLFSALIVSVLFLGSCLKDGDTAPQPHAVLTMVNGFPSTSPVGYALENNVLTPGLGIDYRSYSYVNIFPGTRRLLARQYGRGVGASLVDTVHTFRDSSFYTSFLYGDVDDVKHLLIEDQPLEELGSESGFRFLHLGANVGAVTVYFDSTDEPIFSNRQLENSLDSDESDDYDFIAQPSGTTKVIVRGEDGETLVEREYDFMEGYQYSLILIGNADSEDFPLYLGVVRQYRSTN